MTDHRHSLSSQGTEHTSAARQLLRYLLEDFEQRDAAGVGAVDDALRVLQAEAHHCWVDHCGGDAHLLCQWLLPAVLVEVGEQVDLGAIVLPQRYLLPLQLLGQFPLGSRVIHLHMLWQPLHHGLRLGGALPGLDRRGCLAELCLPCLLLGPLSLLLSPALRSQLRLG